MQSDMEKLEHFLQLNPSIKHIRIQWIDYSGVLRARFVPIARCREIASGRDTVHLAQNSMLIPISTAPRIFSISDYHETWKLQPDWSSLRCCGFYPSHAAVMSFIDQTDSDTRFDKCPRMLLDIALERLKSEWDGAQVRVGFEIEVVLLDSSDNLVKPLDRLNGYSRTAGLRAESLELIEEIVDALKCSSINIHHFHAEAYDQLEIALAPEPAVQAVDSLILAQETIRVICIRRNLKATMAPKPIEDGPLSGLHLHLSVNRPGDLPSDHFIAGVLSHMSSLCAFGMANYDSYARSVGDASGAWIGFGTDNRDFPVRKISEWHWEFRMMDGTSNPYLFLAAVLLTGFNGFVNKKSMTWQDCKFFPHLLEKKVLASFGITESMPTTFKEALNCLKEDKVMESLINQDLLKWYLSVKEKDEQEFSKKTVDQRRRRFLEYF